MAVSGSMEAGWPGCRSPTDPGVGATGTGLWGTRQGAILNFPSPGCLVEWQGLQLQISLLPHHPWPEWLMGPHFSPGPWPIPAITHLPTCPEIPGSGGVPEVGASPSIAVCGQLGCISLPAPGPFWQQLSINFSLLKVWIQICFQAVQIRFCL